MPRRYDTALLEKMNANARCVTHEGVEVLLRPLPKPELNSRPLSTKVSATALRTRSAYSPRRRTSSRLLPTR